MYETKICQKGAARFWKKPWLNIWKYAVGRNHFNEITVIKHLAVSYNPYNCYVWTDLKTREPKSCLLWVYWLYFNDPINITPWHSRKRARYYWPQRQWSLLSHLPQMWLCRRCHHSMHSSIASTPFQLLYNIGVVVIEIETHVSVNISNCYVWTDLIIYTVCRHF